MTSLDETHVPSRVNFFISYTGTDTEWAGWIAWELERVGFTYRMQAEHFPPGSRFLNEMRRWLQDADQLIAILSRAYFESPFASLEMNSAVAEDPLGLSRRVIPVRVLECTMPTIFKDLVYIDLVGKSEQGARAALIAGVRAAKIGAHAGSRSVTARPAWPPTVLTDAAPQETRSPETGKTECLPVRIQFFACDVGRGLDLKGQYQKLHSILAASRFSSELELRGEFDVTDANLFAKLASYRPHVVHIAGNQNGGDVLFPSQSGGEVVVPDEAVAGLLSSLGPSVRLAIIDTCKSYTCAKRVAEVVDCAIGVDDDIYDNEATRFYEVFYQAVGAGHSIKDAHGQAVASLRFMGVPTTRIPKLCVKAHDDASKIFLVG